MNMSAPTDAQRMEKIVSLCKRRGFIFQSSEIYGGLNGAWDYGPLGVELKRNLKNYWWRVMVHERDDVVGMDGAILTHPAVLKASGHVEGFSDPMIDCRTCKAHFRADQLVETLTQAGLPAMQRPFQLRRQQLQQVVLGPFFSRSDAAADLRRLQELGGYDDATVVASSQ